MRRKKRILLIVGIITVVLGGNALYLFLPIFFPPQCSLEPPEFFALDWHPNRNLIAARGISGLFLYSDTLENVTPRDVFGSSFPGLDIGWSADGNYLAIGDGDSSIQIWDVKTFEMRGKLAVPRPERLYFLSWSPDGTEIAAYSEQRVSIWSASKFSLKGYFYGHTNFVQAASWNPDGKLIASTGLDGMIYIWNASSRQKVLSIVSPAGPLGILVVQWNPIEPYFIATGESDGLVRVWDTRSGTLYRSLDSQSSPFWISALAWSHDGKRIALTSDRLQIWDVASGRKVFELKGHERLVKAVAWSSDDRKLVSAGNDGTIRIWDTTTGQLLHMQLVLGDPVRSCPY
jgi:WD40 repeat protein